MKENFESLKAELIENIKPHNPCASEYKKALSATNESELLNVIYNNLNWCIERKCITHEYFSKFDQEAYIASGISNSGKENAGFVNSGNSNSGNRNSGYSNSGDSNSGYRNSGNSNSGNSNSGNWNSGNWNSGNSNSGNRNSGNWNSGNWNSGDSNSGYRNSGAFCADSNPKVWLFDQPTDIYVKDWENSKPFRLMSNGLSFTFWIHQSEMNEQEKKDNPKYETTEGYLKSISHNEGWMNFWGNLSEEDKKEFTSLPNFNSETFYKCTGIKL